MDTVRVAFVGAGAMAREHMRAFAAIDDVILAGIHSRTFEKAKSLADEFGVPHSCTSIRELYEKTSADLVVIAVPELAARSVAEAAFEYPWQVLMEKPAGHNLADAEAILAAAERRDRRVWVGLNRRFLSSSQAALDDLRQREGRRLIHVQDQQSLATARAIGHPEEVVQNWMYANSIHLIDYLAFFGRGEVCAVVPVWPWRGDKTETMLIAVEFTSGDRGIYEAVWNGPGPWAVTVMTPEVRWELRPLEQARYQLAGTRKLEEVATHEWDAAFKPGFRRQAEEVVRAVRGLPSQAVAIAEATETMRLISRIYRQSQEVIQAA